MDRLIFEISDLLKSPIGNTELYSFDVPLDLENIEKTGNITGKMEIMRMEDGVNAVAQNVEIKLKSKCSKCLKNFTEKVKIPFAEREFFMDKPKEADDVNDIYLIDKKTYTIDVTELLRQEIILHFPIISVCSSSCKGLCPYCGKNKNLAKCTCQQSPEEFSAGNKPLAALKELLNQK